MSYDIPPPLQHKEKIVFGLTFEQLGYAAPAFLLIFLLVFKSGLPIAISGTIGILIAVVAVLFMFFDAKNKLLYYVTYFRKREVQINNQTLHEIVDIERIETSVVKSAKGTCAVLEVIPLNFMIKQDEEKNSIILCFQKFLNSLDFPVQIHISSHPISLRMHLQYLATQTKEMPELYDAYCKFIKQTIADNNVKNRRFHVIIPKTYDIEIQTKVCEEKLKSLGVKVRRLADNELVTLFQDYIAGKEEKILKNEQVIENYTNFLLSPEKLTFFQDYLQSDKKFCKVIAVTGYPHTVEEGFLDKIISSGQDYDISIHIEPFPIDFTMIQLNRELQKQQADLYAENKKGIINPSLEIKFKSTRSVLEDLQKGKQKLFHVSLYFMCKGTNKEEIDVLARKIKAELDSLMIENSVPTFRMMDAYSSMLPLAKNVLAVKRNIPTIGLSAFFPFSSPFLDIEHDGILLGLNKNKIPYIKNPFHLTNANGIILATSGAGKSYFTKLLISRQFMNGCDVLIIDPQGEYSGICRHYHGEVVTISKNSSTIINPLDLMGHDYLEKRLSLMDIFQLMFGDLTEVQKAILDKAIDMTYQRKGITKDEGKDNKPPIMEDVYNELLLAQQDCAQLEEITYRALLNRIHLYTKAGVFGFLNKQTDIDFKNKFVCFNIGNMPKQVKPLVMYLLLDYIYMRMKKSLNKKILVIDEAWAMLQTAEESSYIFEIVKTCRKYNLGLLMITQDVADLVGSKAGHAVLANTSYTFLLRQKPAVIDSVVRTFHLSSAEKEYLITAEKGKGIVILENEHQELEVIASEKEHELITTNPNEQGVKKRTLEEKKDVNILLDIEIDVYSAWDKTAEEKIFLSNNGYVVGNFHNLTLGRHRPYFVKKRNPESAPHTFCVDLIYQEIWKHTDQVWKYRTEKPDILFINKAGEEIAIEVETGMFAKYDSKKRQYTEKFEKLKKEYGKRCFIFLTSAKTINSYVRYGLPILTRVDILEFVTLEFSEKNTITSAERFNVTKE